MAQINTDILLVGAGPIGLEIAVGLKKSGLDYQHLDAGQIGQVIYDFAPQTRFFSSNERIAIAGVSLQTSDQGKATREQYLAYLRSVVEQFDLPIRTFERVIQIHRTAGGGFAVGTRSLSGENTYYCQRVILATGGTSRPRRLGIPGEDLPHVKFQFADPHFYFRKLVLIVGGRNSAVEAALRCHHAGARVALSYRRPGLIPSGIKYWLEPEFNGLVDNGTIISHFSTVPISISPGLVRLRRDDGSEYDFQADFVLFQLGYEADMSLYKMAGIELRGPSQEPNHNPLTMHTNVPGIYVAGTAIGGTQENFRVFIENCHVHASRIIAHLTGRSITHDSPSFLRPES